MQTVECEAGRQSIAAGAFPDSAPSQDHAQRRAETRSGDISG